MSEIEYKVGFYVQELDPHLRDEVEKPRDFEDKIRNKYDQVWFDYDQVWFDYAEGVEPETKELVTCPSCNTAIQRSFARGNKCSFCLPDIPLEITDER